MGLDISVSATPAEVKREIAGNPEMLLVFENACTNLGLEDERKIGTRPGSYVGLHRVRTAYARVKGVDAGDSLVDWQKRNPLPMSHLVMHSDCGGWYLPEDFVKPMWNESVTVGSSVRLLAELREIDREGLDGVEGSAFDAIVVPAVASVHLRVPISFH